MTTTTQACLNATGKEIASAVCPSRWHRYEFRRFLRGYVVARVLVDVDDDGHEDWAEQAPDEIRWFPSTPTPRERRMLRRWQKSGRPPQRGPFKAVVR